ncbi:MAG: insulinase family protein [Muribaculaceae bacterium]|nr:insulinase family protein [Muribaculaceae bacterium]
MIEANRFSLPNGLRIVHNYDSGTAMVALNISYNVGARDEHCEMTGLAHLFEHLMFGGSANIPEFDTAIENAGGWNNAWTSNDYTNFYDVIPAHNAETAFWLESDRMLSLAFSEKSLETQRHVVIEEFKEVCLNKPYGDMAHHLRSLIFTQHPYRYPTIGKEFSHIEKVSQQDIREFFYSHYAPNNAVLAVSGNITLEETQRLAEKWFGDIPQREIAPRMYEAEPEQHEHRRKTVYGKVPQTVIIKAYRMPGYFSPDYIPCDIITDLLASGRSSRFYRNLLMNTDMFTEADASISGSDEPGYLMLTARLRDNNEAAIANAEKALETEALSLANGSLSEYELTRTINRYESNNTFGTINFLAKAQALAMSEMHNEDINDTVPRYRSVTTDVIARVATDIFTPDRCSTLIYRPK